MQRKCRSPPHVFLFLAIRDRTPAIPGPPLYLAGMPGKVREPFAYGEEPDGSVAVAACPIGSREKGRIFHHVGWIRSADGAVLSSTTFEEMQDYSTWVRHDSADEAISSLTGALINMPTRVKTDEEASRIRSLRRSLDLLPKFSFRAREALKASARSALMAAASNMLRVSTYEDVMQAVRDALASDVMGS